MRQCGMNATKTPRKSPARPAKAAKTAPKRITPEKRVPKGPGGFARVTATPAAKKVVTRARYGLSAAQRAELRGRAHDLDPVVMIGADGLTPGVVKEAEAAIDAHDLIKIRVFGDDRDERIRLFERLCAALSAEPVQHIGKLLVLYRRGKLAPDTPAERPEPGTGPRSIVVSKPSRSGKRGAKRTRVTLLGNQRVTAGGTVKRKKPRQKSIKKSHQD